MKIIAIGDIHGRDVWKQIVETEQADKFVFIGDYVDTHENISPGDQARNFEDLLAFKEQNRDKVVLLIGNHDYHYLPDINAKYSGFQGHMLPVFRGMLKRAIDRELIQACFVADGVIYTHAGITSTWAENNHVPEDNLQEYMNNYFLHTTYKFGFQRPNAGYANPYGDDIFQSPLWVRPQSLLADKLHGFKQVVGHTTKDSIQPSDGVAFIDTLGTSGEYLLVKEGKFQIKQEAVC